MNSTTPQTVRSLLQSIPRISNSTPSRLTRQLAIHCWRCSPSPSSSPSCRAFSTRNSEAFLSHLARNGKWVRNWSSSAIRNAPNDRSKPPPDLFHMPPPSSHVDQENKTPQPTLDQQKTLSTYEDEEDSFYGMRKPPRREQRETVPDDMAASSSSAEAERAAAAMPMPPPPPSSGQEDTLTTPTLPEKEDSPVDNAAVSSSSSSSSPPPPSTDQADKLSEETKNAAPESDPIHTPAPEAKPSASDEGASSASALPSESQKSRWQLSIRTQKWMDDTLAKAAIFSQQLNTYTGTDYSAIEALRREIINQERDVKQMHVTIAAAKEAYTQAHVAQSASQKEVVGLLERKHSWGAGDLERYMSLIRSEHLNEQAVQRAKDDLEAAERSLEDARSALERKERKQYHEEQIWSDTIRRNSTWVTFGLMGLNIFLLLANLALIEPWRRRRLVKEVRSALEENAAATSASITAASAPTPIPTSVSVTAPAVRESVETSIDETAEPVEVDVEETERKTDETVPEPFDAATEEDGERAGNMALAAGEMLPDEALEVAPSDGSEAMAKAETAPPRVFSKTSRVETAREILEERWEHWRKVVQDMFSDQQVTLTRVDLTTVMLESAAAGIALTGFLVLLFNPR